VGKKEGYKDDLIDLFDEFLESGVDNSITWYLLANSNLPGPRGNIELGKAFSEVIGTRLSDDPEKLRVLCMKFVEISPTEAPVGDPKEFLPFCGTLGIGVISSISGEEDRRSDEFMAFRKGMGYCLSVATVSSPEAGKKLMEEWALSEDKDIRWIIRENLKKKRLLKMDEEWVSMVKYNMLGQNTTSRV